MYNCTVGSSQMSLCSSDLLLDGPDGEGEPRSCLLLRLRTHLRGKEHHTPQGDFEKELPQTILYEVLTPLGSSYGGVTHFFDFFFLGHTF